MCYQIVKQDEWIAMAGSIGDWYMPDFFKEFAKKNPKLLNGAKEIGEILFETKLGDLIKILSFNLKGNTSEVRKSIKKEFHRCTGFQKGSLRKDTESRGRLLPESWLCL